MKDVDQDTGEDLNPMIQPGELEYDIILFIYLFKCGE